MVLRTFSKAMALAGLRVGYLLAAPRLVREIDKARLPYNLNFFSQMAALAALDAARDAAPGVRVPALRGCATSSWRRCGAMPGVKVHPSRANFFLLELAGGRPEGGVRGALRRGASWCAT